MDYVELLVGNARQAAYYYRVAFGMRLVGYLGPETGTRDRVSYVLQQGKIRLVLTTSLYPDSEIADHVRRHGDGIYDIGLWVDDAEKAWLETTRRGATTVRAPFILAEQEAKNADSLEHHSVRVKLASIATFGDTIHTFVERSSCPGPFLPGFAPVATDPVVRPVGLLHVDHIVGNVSSNEMDRWVDFYRDVMGFTLYQHFDAKQISTEYSALMSKVMTDNKGRIKLPINEPAEGRRKSQIEEYLEFYGGPGIQHIAMATDDIVYTVSKLQEQGVEFLQVPRRYYAELQARVGPVDESLHELERLGILVDRDDEGYMLQVFTRPVQDRPTVFFEIIQRKGSRGFGQGNFKALFEAIEHEQAKRGNL